MVVDFLPVLKHREEVKSTRDAERHPYFYSKTLVNTEKMLESPDFACTLKETKTTIPHQPYAEADKRVRSEAGQIQAVRGESRRI